LLAKLAGVRERGEVHRGSDRRWRCGVVDGDYAAAIRAAAQMRSVILIEREIPENDALRPVASGFDDEARLSHEEIAFLPFAA